MYEIKKLPTKEIILDALRSERVLLTPLGFVLVEEKPRIAGKYCPDALVEGRWASSSIIFAAEIRALSTPKSFSEGIAILKTAGLPKNRPPLLITPFLSESQLQELESEGISGVDLCGNGVITVPPRLMVFRTGSPNRFPSFAPIKNVYRKNSSLVGRLLFSCPRIQTVGRIVEEIARRNRIASSLNLPSLTVGTVSKALARMEEDLIIVRESSCISLLQPDTLLEKLSRNYSPALAEAITLKVNVTGQTLSRRLGAIASVIKTPIAATGLSSVGRYAIMQREEKLSVYCPCAEMLIEKLASDASAANRFPNLEIFESQDPTLYFDAVDDESFLWASPVQTFLELMAGDKRDQETAAQVRSLLIW